MSVISGASSGFPDGMLKADYDPNNDGVISEANGGTNATTAADARTNLSAQQQDEDLDAIALLGTGFPARTGTDTWAARSFAGTGSNITVSNGDGVSGNPTFDVGSNVLVLGGSQTLTGTKDHTVTPKIDTISEKTSTNGVDVDSVLLKDGFIRLNEYGSDPSAPASGKVILYGKDSSGIARPFFEDADATINPAIITEGLLWAFGAARVNCSVWPSGAVGGSPNLDGAIGSISLTPTAGSYSIPATNAFGRAGSFDTNTTSGNAYGWRCANSTVLDSLPTVVFITTLTAVTSVRWAFGLQSTATNFFTADAGPASEAYIGFSFSTNRSDTELQAMGSDGTTAWNSTTSVGTASFDTTSDLIMCVMVVNSTTSVSFYVLDSTGAQLGSTVTRTTNLPAAGTSLKPFFGLATLTNASRSSYFYGMTIIHNASTITTFPV